MRAAAALRDDARDAAAAAHMIGSEVHEPESIEEAAIVAGEEPDGYIERVMYAPPYPDWKSSEETVLARLEEANTAIEATLEDEPVGIDDLLNAPPGTGTASGAATAAFTLREEGLEEAALWVIQISQRVVAGSLAIDEAQRMVRDRAQEISDAAPISAIALSTFAEQLGIAEKDVVMGAKMQVSSRGEIKKGYDLVRWGNIGDVAFFHAREEGRVDGEIPAQRMQLVEHVAEVLLEVCAVFDYNPGYVTLFWQPHSVSRFIEQKLLFNIWPVEEHQREHGVVDVRTHEFVHLYIYALMVHKLAHFHDIVHGTRHDFYMQELRIEFMMAWLEYLESKGFDPARLETSSEFNRMLKGSNVAAQGNDNTKAYVTYAGGAVT